MARSDGGAACNDGGAACNDGVVIFKFDGFVDIKIDSDRSFSYALFPNGFWFF